MFLILEEQGNKLDYYKGATERVPMEDLSALRLSGSDLCDSQFIYE